MNKNILFQRPDVKKLDAEGFMCIDGHCHTHFSDGCDLKKTLLCCEKKGIGIAVTDHNAVGGAIAAMKQKNIDVIPGIEINTTDGPHFLAYFYDVKELNEFYQKHIHKKKFFNKKFFTNMAGIGLLESAEILEKYNCIRCLPHPYAPYWGNVERAIKLNPENKKVFKKIDAIEVISGVQLRIANRKAVALQQKLNCGVTAGSDAHGLVELGSCITAAQAENVEEFLDMIKKRKSFAIGRESKRQKAVFAFRALKKQSSRFGKIIKNKIFSSDEEIT